MAENLSNNSEEIVQRNEKGQLLPGVILNPAGKPKGARHMTTLLEEAIKKVADGDAEAADIQIVRKVIEKAKAGEFKHTELIWDRLEGKAPQKIELEGKLELEPSEKIKELAEKLKALDA
jgi:hypothetical protein